MTTAIAAASMSGGCRSTVFPFSPSTAGGQITDSRLLPAVPPVAAAPGVMQASYESGTMQIADESMRPEDLVRRQPSDAELDTMRIVAAICTKTLPAERLRIRSDADCCTFLLDGEERLQIARLGFGPAGMTIEIEAPNGRLVVTLDSPTCLFRYSDALVSAVHALRGK